MLIRTIAFGYRYSSGRIIIDEKESGHVMQIYNSYLKGESLLSIAQKLEEDNVVYHEGRTNWSKVRISRILEDVRYIGEKGYPILIDLDMLNQVAQRKQSRLNIRSETDNEKEELKEVVRCKECGGNFTRVKIKSGRLKWACKNGCRNNTFLVDDNLMQAVLDIISRVNLDKSLLKIEKLNDTYYQTPEIMRYTNEIGRITNSTEPCFNTGKKIILMNAGLKFKCCELDRSDYTNAIIKWLSNVKAVEDISAEIIDSTISRIYIASDNKIEIEFNNGKIIEGGIGSGKLRRKNCNQD